MAVDCRSIILAVLAAGFLVANTIVVLSQETATPLDPQQVEFFEAHIRPLLIDHCYECHSHEHGESNGKLYLDSAEAMRRGGTKGAVIAPGKPDQSLLMRVVNYRDRNLQMPPQEKLSATQIATLQQWIEMGATDPRLAADQKDNAPKNTPKSSPLERDPKTHWAFNLPTRHPIPMNHQADADDPIDLIAATAAEAAGIKPNARANRETLVKRLYFDLTGLPPSHAEARQFADSARPDSYQRLVDRLLATPDFGERHGRHWLDVARYADTVGYALGGKERRYKGSERFRDWTIRAFANDMPYDEMVRHQLSADRTDPNNENGNLDAMGFLTLGRQFLNPLDTIDDRIDVITRGLLGLTVSCARCHDHKFDPIPTEDYYALGGIIASSQRPKDGISPLMLEDKPNPIDSPVLIRGQISNRGPIAPRQFLTALRADNEPRFTDGSGRLELAEKIATANNPLTARVMVNRVWTHLIGRPLVDTTSDFGFRTAPPAIPAVLDNLSVEFASHWSIKKLVRRIVLSKIYQQAAGADKSTLERDPDNRLLARGNRKRRDFESLRDSVLAVSETLDRSMGGAPVEITADIPTPRRTIYAMIDRQNLPALFRTFDFASPDAHSPGRYFTTVPQQALFLMNSPQMIVFSRGTADVVRRQTTHDSNSRSLAKAMFMQVLGRLPAEHEWAAASAFLERPLGQPDVDVDPRSLWTYGTANLEGGEGITEFRPLAFYRDKRWQVAEQFPTKPPYGHAYLGKNGGHAPNDPKLAVVRRYTAPKNGTVTLRGQVSHSSDKGDGVISSIWIGKQRVFESRQFNRKQNHGPYETTLQAGDTVDLVVSCAGNSSYDSFQWTATLQLTDSDGQPTETETETHFSGPFEQGTQQPLDRLSQLAQTLILSNEFAFID